MYIPALLKKHEIASGVTHRIWNAWIDPQLHEENPRINIILDNGGYASCLVEDWHPDKKYDYKKPGDWDIEICPDYIYDMLPRSWKNEKDNS